MLPKKVSTISLIQLTFGSWKKNRAHPAKDSQRARAKRGRKVPVRAQSRRHARRALAAPRKLSPLARLVQALRKEKIRFQVAGMSAAILQGVPATTLDTDLWMDLPSRQYIRVLNLCRSLGAAIAANTVVELKVLPE